MDSVIEWTKNLWEALQAVGDNLAAFFNSGFVINGVTYTFWDLLPLIIGSFLVLFIVATIVKMVL